MRKANTSTKSWKPANWDLKNVSKLLWNTSRVSVLHSVQYRRELCQIPQTTPNKIVIIVIADDGKNVALSLNCHRGHKMYQGSKHQIPDKPSKLFKIEPTVWDTTTGVTVSPTEVMKKGVSATKPLDIVWAADLRRLFQRIMSWRVLAPSLFTQQEHPGSSPDRG